MIAEPLSRVLEATGYLRDGKPAAPSVIIGDALACQQPPSFAPEACWRGGAPPRAAGESSCSREITVYFKYVDEPIDPTVAIWQRELWNRGFTPLLWVVSQQTIDLYNGFARPRSQDSASEHLLKTFRAANNELEELDQRAGRLSMETGQFWQNIPEINRDTAVDRQLLRELRILEKILVESTLELDEIHGLIIRSVFAKYLVDRKILTPSMLDDICGQHDLSAVFDDRTAAQQLFRWLQNTFNGDMFPPSSGLFPNSGQLEKIGNFFRGENQSTGQQSLFPYQFNVIPIEFISAIYEQFVHSSIRSHASQTDPVNPSDIHYSPMSVVSLILDEVMDELSGTETVLDLTCGSGVFLVESLRRLVRLKSRNSSLSRNLILETLYHQIYGIDECETAIRISAFSLYLTALELDRSTETEGCPKFRPIVGRTLLIGNAFDIHRKPSGQVLLTSNGSLRQFDIIVGNPPWSYLGHEHAASLRAANIGQPRIPRGVSFDFLQRAIQFSHERTRFGMVVSAMPLFAISRSAREAVRKTIERLLPATLVNLSELSLSLFSNAKMPAMIILGRHKQTSRDELTIVQARWSLRNENGGMIELAPSDVSYLSYSAWKIQPILLKTAFFGQDRDLSLLFDLIERHDPLEQRLDHFKTGFKTGLIVGNKHQKDSSFLIGLPYAERSTSSAGFSFPKGLPDYEVPEAGKPRNSKTFEGPLLLVRQFLLQDSRPRVVIYERNIVFNDAYYGVSFAGVDSKIFEIIAGILFKLTSWYLLMTGSIFGLRARQIKQGDLTALPMPDLEAASESEPGRRILRFVADFRCSEPKQSEWEDLDSAVFDLYQLDTAQRVAMHDGYVRSLWEWKEGRLTSVEPVDIDDLKRYADAFLGTMNAWLSLAGRRYMCAEIYELPYNTAIRVVRFFIEGHPLQADSKVVIHSSSLSAVLDGIRNRTEVQVEPQLLGLRELRVHARDEVNIIKSAARRNWLGVQGLSDADAVVRDFVEDRWPI